MYPGILHVILWYVSNKYILKTHPSCYNKLIVFAPLCMPALPGPGAHRTYASSACYGYLGCYRLILASLPTFELTYRGKRDADEMDLDSHILTHLFQTSWLSRWLPNGQAILDRQI